MSELLVLEDLEREARDLLDPGTWAYLAGGAGAGTTIERNRLALDSLPLTPAVLRGQALRPNLATELFGRSLPLPILLAPTSPQRLFHDGAELETAKGAAASGIASIISTDSHYSFEEIVRASGSDCWFQLYCYRDRSDVGRTLDYAGACGATAIVVTVDADHSARRIAAKRAGFEAPASLDFGTLRALGLFDGEVPAGARLERLPLTWEDLGWIRARTPLPLLVKGVLRPVDALRCLNEGADGIIVSNHGGRQLDGAVPSPVALPAVAAAIEGRMAVLCDGGIRSGIDVVRALALGASAVCVGRPYLWGLAAYGADGVAACIRILEEELLDALRQLGMSGVGDIDASCIGGSAGFPVTAFGTPGPVLPALARPS